MHINKLLLLLVITLALSCTNESQPPKESTEDLSEQRSELSSKDVEQIDFTDYALSTEAEQIVANWEKYQELAIQINYLKKGDFSFFNSEKELLITFIEDFKKGLPKDLSTNPVMSRLAIVETRLLKLNDDLTLDNIVKQDKISSIKAVLVSFSNLNFQINKKLERDLFDSIIPE